MTPLTPEWWRLIASMPIDEAEQLLREVKTEILDQTLNTPAYLKASATITRINEEIAKISRVREASHWSKALRQVLTPEQYEQVRIAKVVLEIEASKKHRGQHA